MGRRKDQGQNKGLDSRRAAGPFNPDGFGERTLLQGRLAGQVQRQTHQKGEIHYLGRNLGRRRHDVPFQRVLAQSRLGFRLHLVTLQGKSVRYEHLLA